MKGQGKEYAEALFSLAMEEGQMEAYLDALREIAAVFRENPAYVDLLVSPGIPARERSALVTQGFSGQIPDSVLSFLCVLTEHGGITSFSDCLTHYEELCNAAFGVSVAEVTSAVELTDTEKERLEALLAYRSGHRVQVRYATDKSILGGMVVRMDDTVMDGSIRHRLNEILKGATAPAME